MLDAKVTHRPRERAVIGVANIVGERQRSAAPYQTRTCTRCGRHTTFVLDDPAGGWYACIGCGRYA